MEKKIIKVEFEVEERDLVEFLYHLERGDECVTMCDTYLALENALVK